MQLDHIAINVKNVRKAVKWYVSNLGATIKYVDDTWASMSLNGITVALTMPNQHPPHIAFRIANAANLTGSDGEVKKHRDGSSYVYASDLDGNTIEWLVYTNELE